MIKYFVKYNKNYGKTGVPEMVSELLYSTSSISSIISNGYDIVMLVKLF